MSGRTSLRSDWPVAVTMLMLALSLLAAFNIASEVGHPFGGFVPLRNHLSNTWQVDSSTPPWWPALAAGHLRNGDVLVALEGEPFDAGSVRRYVEAWREGQGSLRLTALRDGTLLEVDLPVKPFTLGDFLDLKVPDLILAFALGLLALAVYQARPRERVNRVFALATGTAAGAVAITTPGLFAEAGSLTRALHLAWVPTICLCSALFLHAAALFPEPVRFRSRWWLGSLYASVTVLVGAYALSMLLRWHDSGSVAGARLSTLSNAGLIGLDALAIGFYLLRLLRLASQPERSRRLRRQVNVLLVGLLLSTPYLAILLLKSVGTHGGFWNGLDLRWTALPIPISLAFVILRYQTFRPMHPAVLNVLILTTSALMASLVTWALRLTRVQWADALGQSPFLAVFAVALASALFWSRHISWQGALGRLFDWDRQSYGAVRQFGQEVIDQMDPSRLPDAIAAALVLRMELERAAVWLWSEEQDAFLLAGRAGAWPEPPAAALPALAPSSTSRPLRLQGAEGVATGAPQDPSQDEGVDVMAPLWAAGRPVGLLGLGRRWDEEIFDERDLEVVELIAQQAALFLLTATQVEQLRRVPHQIAAVQERERFKIAQELHDTIQQFFGRLPFYLEVSRDAAREHPAETEAILERCLADVEAAAQTVRQIRHSLAPLQLERSLVEPLRSLVRHFQSCTHVETEMRVSGEVDSSLPPEARHALYRVVQQALDNVAAHAGARRVTVALTRSDGKVEFSVADDGRGLPPDRQTLKRDAGFGLKSMEARITSLGGTFTIESQPGQGTRLSGWLPAGTA